MGVPKPLGTRADGANVTTASPPKAEFHPATTTRDEPSQLQGECQSGEPSYMVSSQQVLTLSTRTRGAYSPRTTVILAFRQEEGMRKFLMSGFLCLSLGASPSWGVE